MIDLAEYAPWITKYIKTRKLACIYVVSYEGGRPSKIGCAQDISARFSAIQMSNMHALSVEYLLWAPDMHIARIIEQAAQLQLRNSLIRGEWFDIHAEMAAKIIRETAKRNNFGHTLVEHDDLIKQLADAGLRQKLDRRRRQAVNGEA